MEFESTYPCRPTAPRQARAWSQQRLRDASLDHPGATVVADDAAVVVSELITNAVQAGCGAAVLSLEVDGARVRIAVSDDVGGQPQVAHSGPSDVRGRGLAIVAALADTWGVERRGTGKEVWVELTY